MNLDPVPEHLFADVTRDASADPARQLRPVEAVLGQRGSDPLQTPKSLPPYVMSTPAVLSEGVLFGPNHDFIRGYVTHWIRHPDPGSAFDKASKFIRWIPEPALLRLMMAMRYDGLVFSEAGKVVAHVFFQRHQSALHMFSVRVCQDYQGQGLAEQALTRFLEHARAQPGIDCVRLGSGGHPAVARVCQKFQERENELRISVGEKGWILFRHED